MPKKSWQNSLIGPRHKETSGSPTPNQMTKPKLSRRTPSSNVTHCALLCRLASPTFRHHFHWPSQSWLGCHWPLPRACPCWPCCHSSRPPCSLYACICMNFHWLSRLTACRWSANRWPIRHCPLHYQPVCWSRNCRVYPPARSGKTKLVPAIDQTHSLTKSVNLQEPDFVLVKL